MRSTLWKVLSLPNISEDLDERACIETERCGTEYIFHHRVCLREALNCFTQRTLKNLQGSHAPEYGSYLNTSRSNYIESLYNETKSHCLSRLLQVLVANIDSGQKIWANVNQLYELSPELKRLSEVATCAALAGIEPKNRVTSITSILSSLVNKVRSIQKFHYFFLDWKKIQTVLWFYIYASVFVIKEEFCHCLKTF